MELLDEQALLGEAQERTQLRDFGDDSFREPLAVLLRALREEADLSEAGRATQHARILDSLVTRLRVEDWVHRHPEILEREIAEPVVIVGLARTGTTMLHRLLASSDDFQAARWWEVRHPAPFPDSDWRGDDPRIPAAHEEVRLTLEAVPVLATMHPWDPEGADEEVLLLEHSFRSHMPESAANVPSYRAWLDRCDLRPAYRYLDRLLRLIDWQKAETGRGGGRWVLKAPFHLGSLDALFEVFPGSRVIQTHRDPVATIPSAASMYRALWELNTETVDAREVGRQVCERYAGTLHRSMRAREKHPAEWFQDVWYDDVQRDPLAQVHRIHEWLGLAWRPEAEAVMRAWLEANSRDRRPPHRYTLEESGYSEAGLAETFAEYRERYILPRA